MANASGTITGSTSGGITPKIEWESTPHPETGKSRLVINLYLKSNRYINLAGSWTFTVDGSTSGPHGQTPELTSGDWVRVLTRGYDIVHTNAKSVSVSVSGGISGAGHTTSISGSVSLPALYQAARIMEYTATVMVGNSMHVVLDTSGSTGYHRIDVSLGGSSVWAYYDGRTDGYIPISASWADLIVAPATSQGGTVTITSYLDSEHNTSIGYREYNWVASISQDAPTVDDGWVAIRANSLNADIRSWGVAVQGYSRAKAVFDASKCHAASGSSITPATAFTMVCEGKTYQAEAGTGDDAGKWVAYSDFFGGSGTIRVTVRVTDSRGRSLEAYGDLSVYSYSPPRLIDGMVYRSDAYGNASNTGSYLTVVGNGTVADLGEGHNTRWMYLKYKREQDETYPEYGGDPWIRVDGSQSTGKITTVVDCSQYTPLQNVKYDAVVRVDDRLGVHTDFAFPVAGERVAAHFTDGNTGGSIGKRADRSGWMESAWSLHTDGDLAADGSLTFEGKRMDLRMGTLVFSGSSATAQVSFGTGNNMVGTPNAVIITPITYSIPISVAGVSASGFTAFRTDTTYSDVTAYYIAIYWGTE